MFKHTYRIQVFFCCLFIFYLFIPSSLQADTTGCISGDCYNGTGTYTWPNGQKYVGEFWNDKLHKGTLTLPDGRKYVGAFRDGKFVGKGTYTWPDGQKYVGEFQDGIYHGTGTLTLPDGRKYVGEFWNDKFHKGTYTWPDGQKYVGTFRDNKRNGIGTLTLPNGEKYVGEWLDDKRNGWGTLTLPNGEKYIGEWLDDKPVEQKTTAGEPSQPAARTEPQNNEYINVIAGVVIVFVLIFFVLLIFYLVSNNTSSKQEGFRTSQKKQQVYAPNKPSSFKSKEEYNQWKAHRIKQVGEKSPDLIVCPHCDEKVQRGITKCPYCAENISDFEKEDKDKQKDVKEPIMIQETSDSIKSSDIHSQEQIITNASSTNQIKDDSATALKIKMMKLEKLFAEGTITENEFKSKREQLLNNYINE